MGMVGMEVLLPLVLTLQTFPRSVLIRPRRRGSLKVPGGCAKSLRAGFDGTGKSFGHLALCSSPCLVLPLTGSRFTISRLVDHLPFGIDTGGIPCCQKVIEMFWRCSKISWVGETFVWLPCIPLPSMTLPYISKTVNLAQRYRPTDCTDFAQSNYRPTDSTDPQTP
ncbi:hypothetical protein EDD15DRAFT_2336573 [Pisolithus albus]|nr:hypothetical protein EDD15DRAFT_2336573 [Pisolithus albus]